MLKIDLSGRKALVTGGARGIGGGVVRALAECGAAVAFTHLGSARGKADAARLVAGLKAAGATIACYTAAADDMNAMEAVVEHVAHEFQGLDIVVANVGLTWPALLPELDLEGWRHALDINLTTAFIAIKSTLPWLLLSGKASRADVVLIGSSAALDGGGGGVHYAAAKAGLDGLMRACMRELPRQGVHINVIHPCVVDTDLLRERYDDEEKRLHLAQQVPLGRLGQPEDIGGLVAFLCSDLGSFICGQSILVDGGRTFWRQAAREPGSQA